MWDSEDLAPDCAGSRVCVGAQDGALTPLRPGPLPADSAVRLLWLEQKGKETRPINVEGSAFVKFDKIQCFLGFRALCKDGAPDHFGWGKGKRDSDRSMLKALRL